MQRRLGNQGVIDLDRRTGTPRVLARLDGTLTGASSRSPESIASSYVRANLAVLGLTSGDVSATPEVSALPGGVTSVAWRQSVDGIPASDHSLRVDVGADGSVLSVLGSPEHALDVSTVVPALDAGEAVRAVQDDVGVYRSLVRRRGPSGAQRTTDYGDDTAASLVTSGDRLAWRVRYRAGDDAVYDATVDARTGAVLRRVNMVKSESPARVWERFPGSGMGGTAATVDLEQNGWLSASAANLNGPNAHVYSDLDDNGVAATSEEVARVGGGFSFPLQPVAGTGCDAEHLCAWSGASDRTLNRQQDAVQAFYFANRFHDHLAEAPIGFTAAKGAFEGADDLLLETMDGASTGPDSDHLNNANMFTPPDGSHPRMQMYLWSSPFRRISSGSDAAILYHEYTHGLSNRLVVDADGYGALNSAQAGAMGEAWSDWYAQDFIVDQFPALDTGAVGEVVMGAYTDLTTSRLRYSPLDCPVAAADPIACPGRPALGSGGFSYGDFGRVAGGAEVHADGEIWAQTLWDLRTAVGSAKARALVTTGMSLLPPEPSFLDGRNGILLADQTLFSGADVDVIWSVFAGRGMGFFAAATGGDDTGPAESFALPPVAGAPRGTISGQVTNAIGGAGVSGVTVGLAGGLSSVSAVTGADGRYTISDVPAGTYLKVLAGGGGWDSAVTSLSVSGGTTISYSPSVRRDWSATTGGATVTGSNGREYVEYGCGPNAALDQSQSLGWSTTAGTDKYLIVQLPDAVDVTSFAIDPAETCGDSVADATGGYRVETSPDATAWTVARTGTFTAADRHTSNLLTPTAGGSGVRFARLTLLSSQGGASASYRDLSEFAVYGTPTAAAPVPDTTIAPGGPPFTFTSTESGSTFECTIDAGTFAACTSPFTPGPLPDGDHVFSVRAVGDPTPATRTFTVDTTAPETAIDSGPSPFVFSSNEAGATFECKLDEGDFAPCTSPHALGPLADGAYTFEVRATDATGHTDTTPATRSFTVDTTAPETTLEPGGPPFRFASSEAGSTFECRLDGAAFTACSSPTDPGIGTLSEGTHSFDVRATDAAQNTDQSPATQSFVVDRTGPAVTSLTGPPNRSNDTTPTFTFASAEPDSTFECKLTSPDLAAEFTPCDSPKGYGPLTDDARYTFTVRAQDRAGNYGTPSTYSYTLFTTAPQTGITSGPEGMTNDAGPVFVLASSPPGATFACKLDGTPIVPCPTPLALPRQADGTHTLEVTATDDAGNTDPTPVVRTFTVDTIAPRVTLQSGLVSPVHSGPLAFAVGADEGTLACGLDAGEYGSCAAIIQADTLAAGEHVFRARAEDAAGNISAPVEYAFTVVNAAPTATLALDGTSGIAPLAIRPTIAGADPDRDRLTYKLDFGDGQVASGVLPVVLVAHRYDAPGEYTLTLTVDDGRATATATAGVTVTTPLVASSPPPVETPLSLTLSASSVSLGTFIPGLARDYGAALTAATTGNGTLTVSDASGTAAGHLVGPAGALAQPLQVLAANGAYAPLTGVVAIPASIEFKQSIGADEALKPGAYSKALTFTLAVTTP